MSQNDRLSRPRTGQPGQNLRYRPYKDAVCSHMDQIQQVVPNAQGCEECLQMGDTWVHLRLCRSCGHVGCCDSSKNKHASGHARATAHPIVESYEPGEDWLWCYPDEAFIIPEE